MKPYKCQFINTEAIIFLKLLNNVILFFFNCQFIKLNQYIDINHFTLVHIYNVYFFILIIVILITTHLLLCLFILINIIIHLLLCLFILIFIINH